MSEEEIINLIVKDNGIGPILKYKKINIGFNNKIFLVNDEYIIKICPNLERENHFLNEILFYLNNNYTFLPKMLCHDISKTIVPFCYMIQEKIDGCNLYSTWSSLSKIEQKNILMELLDYLKIIHSNTGMITDYNNEINRKYKKYLELAIKGQILRPEQISYLEELKNIITSIYKPISMSLIHGDLQFNNIIYTLDGRIKIIDFEQNKVAPTEKEFATLFRMADYPDSFMQQGNLCEIDYDSFQFVKSFFIENYPEICGNERFDNNLLIFEILNSLRWILKFPDFPRYNEILFEKSKNLIKRY